MSLIKRIETGEYSVLESGAVILAGASPNLLFFIDDVIVEMRFTNDSNSINPQILYSSPDDKKIIIDCINFEGCSTGRGNRSPDPVININGKEIYIRFMVFPLSNLIRVIYTFYEKTDK